jgi:hypothetical protein
MKDCAECRAYTRTQLGPHSYNHTCDLKQRDFPNAADCAWYQPPPRPIILKAGSGLGYVWDSEPD